MAKRKFVKNTSAEDATLSPSPQENLKDPSEDVQAVQSKKRKAGKSTDDVAYGDREVKRVKKASKTNKTKGVIEEDSDVEASGEEARRAKKARKKTGVVKKDLDGELDGEPVKKAQRKRKTKEEKAAEAMPLATRTIGHKLSIGAHVSAAGGQCVHNSVSNGVHIGANAFALFLKSQRKWANLPLVDEHRVSFLDQCKSHAYNQNEHVVPHGSYLVNLAHTDKERTEQAYGAFLDDLKRCEKLGIHLYNFHPGVANSVGEDRHAAIAHLASNLNRAHNDTSTVVTLLENMAHGGNVLGSTFEDLRDIIALIHDKSRVGVCIDTCHAFAGGYDLRTPAAFKATMDSFSEIVGVQYLRAVHVNDSKAPFASHRDLHANIGTGFLGLRAFHHLVNDSRFEGLPLILETPLEAKDANGVVLKDEKGKVQEDKMIWAREIKLLESLVGMDVESDEFLKLENELARKGEPDRKKLADQIEKKREKDAAKAERAAKKKNKKRKKVDMEETDKSVLSDAEDEDQDDDHGDTQRLGD